jgi:thiamine biosynthesis lipoprotein
MWLPVEDAAIATSGNYEQYVEIGGVRYSHNLDPRTGRPVKGIKSVTIISPSAELSDGLATAVTVMGPDAGLHLLNQLPGVHGIVIDGRDRVLTTDKIKHLTYA